MAHYVDRRYSRQRTYSQSRVLAFIISFVVLCAAAVIFLSLSNPPENTPSPDVSIQGLWVEQGNPGVIYDFRPDGTLVLTDNDNKIEAGAQYECVNGVLKIKFFDRDEIICEFRLSDNQIIIKSLSGTDRVLVPKD